MSKKTEQQIIAEAINSFVGSSAEFVVEKKGEDVQVVYHKDQHIGTIHTSSLDPHVKKNLSPEKVAAQKKNKFWVLAYDHKGDHTDLGKFADLPSAKKALASHHGISYSDKTDIVKDKDLN